MKITFPTTEMQPPLAQDLPDFLTARNLGQSRHFQSTAGITVQIRHHYTKKEHYALCVGADVKQKGSPNPSATGVEAASETLGCQPSQFYCQQT